MTTVAAVPAAVRDLHEVFAWVVVLSNGVVGAWALAADRLDVLRRRELWWATNVAQATVFVQVILGAIALRGITNTDHLRFHMFYGFLAAFSVAIIYSYRSQLAAHRYLLYGFGGLFVMGLGIRAMYLGTH